MTQLGFDKRELYQLLTKFNDSFFLFYLKVTQFSQ